MTDPEGTLEELKARRGKGLPVKLLTAEDFAYPTSTPRPRCVRSPEQHEIEGAFLDVLRGPTGDGQTKRLRGEKPLWKYDPSHRAAMFRHLTRWIEGDRYDGESSAHALAHMAWRALAIAYQEMSEDGLIPK